MNLKSNTHNSQILSRTWSKQIFCLESIDRLCSFSPGKSASTRLPCHVWLLSTGSHAQSLVNQRSARGSIENSTVWTGASHKCTWGALGQILSQEKREEQVVCASSTHSWVESVLFIYMPPQAETRKKSHGMEYVGIGWKYDRWLLSLCCWIIDWSYFSPQVKGLFAYNLSYDGNFYGQSHFML